MDGDYYGGVKTLQSNLEAELTHNQTIKNGFILCLGT